MIIDYVKNAMFQVSFKKLRFTFWDLQTLNSNSLLCCNRQKYFLIKGKVSKAVSCMYSKFVCTNFHYLGHLVHDKLATYCDQILHIFELKYGQGYTKIATNALSRDFLESITQKLFWNSSFVTYWLKEIRRM